MTQLELVDGMVRGSGFLTQLARRPVTVIGTARDAAAVVTTLKPADAYLRVEPVATGADLTGDALVVVTAATALRARAVVAARRAGVPVLADLDVAWLASGAEAFAICGVNAQLAAQLVTTLLTAHAHSVVVFGDDAAGLGRESDVLLVEPSVDQLSAMQVFRPRVAVMLRGAAPLAVRLTSHQTPRDCVVAVDEPADRALANVSRARVVWLSPEHALDHGVYVARNRIAARLNGRLEEICPVDGIPAPELEATLAAVACALWAGLDPEAIGAALVCRFATERARTDRRLTPAAAGRASLGFAGTRTLAARALAMLLPRYAEHRPGSAGAVANVGGFGGRPEPPKVKVN
jgi:UDP-N-acetylmuramoylalanine-D-glutamate ligase